VSKFGSIFAIVHQQQFNIFDIGHAESVESIRSEISSLFVGSITNLGHSNDTLEPSADPAVDTLWLSPAFLDGRFSVRLMSPELLCPFLDDFWFDC